MDIKDAWGEIDKERLALVPILVLLGLAAIANTRALATGGPSGGGMWALYLVHSALLVSFYVLAIVLLFRRRRATAGSRSALPNILAFVGSFLPMALPFLPGSSVTFGSAAVSVVVMTIGMAFSVYSLRTLGRSFSVIPQARSLVRTGPYRYVRHPLYVGEMVAFSGAILAALSLPKVLLLLAVAGLQAYRAVQEEKVLEGEFPEYAEYRTATPRFMPSFARIRGAEPVVPAS